MLADWAAPSGRDRVVGLWRPLTPRDAAPAAAALRPVVSAILHEAPAEVRSAAARAAGSLRVSEADAALAELVADSKPPVTLRVEALKALGEMGSPRLGDALAGTAAATEPELKKRPHAGRTSSRPPRRSRASRRCLSAVRSPSNRPDSTPCSRCPAPRRTRA